MGRDVSGTDIPEKSTLGTETVEGAGRDVIFGVGEVDIFALRMYHDTIRAMYPDIVGDELPGDDLPPGNVYDTVGDFVVHGNATPLAAVNVKRVPVEPEIGDGNVKGVNKFGTGIDAVQL
jgi:hypothetical protein